MLERKFCVKQPGDLVERESQFLERNDLVEANELVGGIVAVIGRGVDVRGFQQIARVIVAQHLDRDARKARKFANAEHDMAILHLTIVGESRGLKKEGRSRDHPSFAHSIFSNIPAAPMPPPMHMVTMPYWSLRRFIS